MTEGRRRRRRRLAGVLAAAGVAAIAVALTWQPATEPSPAATKSAGREAEGVGLDNASTEGVDVGKPPTTAPGGVGLAPEKTGLPAVPAPGGKVRTGTPEEGCFPDMRSYLDEWHRTGVEPEPCFTAQPPSRQEQPEDVRRSYNGERF